MYSVMFWLAHCYLICFFVIEASAQVQQEKKLLGKPDYIFTFKCTLRNIMPNVYWLRGLYQLGRDHRSDLEDALNISR